MSTSVQSQIALRTRKLGVLIRDARLAHRKTVPECARAIGVTAPAFRAFEEGRKAPALPELEALAYFLDLPIDHFWSSESLSVAPPRTEPINLAMLASVRTRVVGARMRQLRNDASISIKTLSQDTGIPVARLKAYELGEKSIPLPELEVIAQALGGRVENFFDQNSPIGQWISQQQAMQEFLKLPPDMQAFVCMPVNRPYLELARKLSTMSTGKLRSVAEDLLDITL